MNRSLHAQDLARSIRDEHDLEEFELGVDGSGNIQLEIIAVPRGDRGKGVGTSAMADLIRFADQNGYLLWLQLADPKGPRGNWARNAGTTSRNRLSRFYKRFGFVPNKGRAKRFELSIWAHMYRPPTNKE